MNPKEKEVYGFEMAVRAFDLAHQMDMAFDRRNEREHLKIAIAAAIMDAYNKGKLDTKILLHKNEIEKKP